MSLGYNINPELWLKTNHFKLKSDHRPQDLLTSDIFTMINELRSSGDISNIDAKCACEILDGYKEIDLKKVFVRAIENERSKRDLPKIDEDHDHDQDLEDAIKLFHQNNTYKYQ
jgi:hypothetical protein